MAVRIADAMSLISDLIDFWKSMHEALAERRRKRAAALQETDPSNGPGAGQAS